MKIKGREYTVTVLPSNQLDEGRPIYMITGQRGAIYHTVRNRPNPDLMFLISEKGRCVMNNVWLTDRNGTLEEA